MDWVTNPLFYGIFIALIEKYNHNSIVDVRSIPEVSKKMFGDKISNLHIEWLIYCIIAAVVLIALFWFIRFVITKGRKQKPNPIDEMDGIEFEKYLAKYFEKQGFDVELTQAGHDFGADLIITRDGVKTAVQAKRYSENVSLSAVQEVFAAAAYYDCDTSLVITNSHYTSSAKKLAEKIGVELWDRDMLDELFSVEV